MLQEGGPGSASVAVSASARGGLLELETRHYLTKPILKPCNMIPMDVIFVFFCTENFLLTLFHDKTVALSRGQFVPAGHLQ